MPGRDMRGNQKKHVRWPMLKEKAARASVWCYGPLRMGNQQRCPEIQREAFNDRTVRALRPSLGTVYSPAKAGVSRIAQDIRAVAVAFVLSIELNGRIMGTRRVPLRLSGGWYPCRPYHDRQTRLVRQTIHNCVTKSGMENLGKLSAQYHLHGMTVLHGRLTTTFRMTMWDYSAAL